ncbi:MAG TPA: thiolase domain-containing protein [Candidatus Thermoplasmatota archaeon]|nr:thiolase domain-containing protein [Candidatus Thermoplasmatota archaeon]
MRDVCVVGVGTTKYGRSDLSARELMTSAAQAAIKSSGADPDKVDSGFFGNAFGVAEKQGHLGPLIMTALGLDSKPATVVETACASGGTAFHHGYREVAGGFSDMVLVGGVERVSMLDTLTATTYFSYGSDYTFEGGNGCSFPGLYATMARAYFDKYGATEQDLAHVAIKNHENATHNPVAHLQKRITMEDVMGSMKVADPLKLYDACPFSDGAAAAILCSPEMAKELTDTPVFVEASQRAGSIASLHDRPDLTSLPGAVLAGQAALRQAKLKVEDIDFFEVHDCFTIAEVAAIEDLGLFKRGTGAKAEVAGETRVGGRRPVNPSGGLKAKGHPVGATGVGQVVEVYEQLLGEAGGRQVENARRGLTHNVGATGGTVVVNILSRRD